MNKVASPAGRLLHANDPCWCGSGRKFKRCHKEGAERIRPATVSPRRAVPEGIERPDYVLNAGGHPSLLDPSMVRPPEVIEAMREAGKVAAQVMADGAAALAVGVTTDEIDVVVHEACLRYGAYPSPLGYQGYPKSVCTSVNEVICHGIPDSRPLADGDIINLDVTVFMNGVHADMNATFGVGDVDEESLRLIKVTSECLDLGIAAARPGSPLSDIGKAIEAHATEHHYGVVRAFVGHGVARTFHGPPSVPHYHDRRADTILERGMTFTIEPMITLGDWRHLMWDDGWTAVTLDGRRTAQFEHTLLINELGAEILTKL